MNNSVNSNRQYNGSLTWQQFLFYETKITAGLVAQNINEDDIIRQIVDGNLFQFPTERMSKKIAKACVQRVNALNNDTLVEMLAHDSAEVGKQINLYAMMKHNRIVWDFMITVIGEKYRTLDFSYSKRDTNDFFFQLQEQDENVSGWTEQTVGKIKQVLNKALVECGYLDSLKSETLNSVYLFPEVEEEIRNNGDTIVFPAFNCFDGEA